MTKTHASVLPYDAASESPFGPGRIEHRTAQTDFTELGAYFLVLPDGGHADPWTLEYEETIFVVEGEASILVTDEDAAESELVGGQGDLIALAPGATVRYGGTPGTRLLLSIAPADWRDRAPRPATPKVLFLTPFHFEQVEHDDEFDRVLQDVMSGQDQVFTADHVARFEADDVDYDEAQTAAILKAVRKANTEGYDAIVIACHYDPALDQARAASQVPVVGPLQLTTAISTQYGPKFAVITDIEEAEVVIGDLVASYGHADACVGVRSIGWDGDDILEDPRGAARAVDAIVEELAAAGEVQLIVIGCTIVSSAYERHRHELPDRGVVVLNSNLHAVKAAAALAAN